MFKNLFVYRLPADWSIDLPELEALLQSQRFVDCAPTQEKSTGWVPPRGQVEGALVESVQGQWLLRMRIESRSLPASVVQRRVRERAEALTASTGRQPGRRELRDLKDSVRHELLPQAFTKLADVLVWIDREDRWLVVDAASQARSDEVTTALVQTLPSFAPRPIDTRVTPAAAMAGWLRDSEAAPGFGLERECELKAMDASGAVVRYARHPLDTEDVRRHIDNGKLPTRLGLTWSGRVSFVLTESFQLKKLAFLEGVMEGADADAQDNFDTDLAISTGELRQLLPDLVTALGGETDPN